MASVQSRKYFYIWLVPLLFALNSLVSFHFPGDEYGWWVVGSLPGITGTLFGNVGDIRGLQFPVAIWGALIMAFVGWRMDAGRVKKRLWFIGMFAAALFVACILISVNTRKIEFLDLVLALFGVGIWLGSLLAVFVAFVARNWIKAATTS